MITISKYNNEFNFIDNSDTIKEIFKDNYKVLEYAVPFELGDVVIDIGANIGAFSIMLAKLFPETTIYSVEPVAETYIKLCKNIELNKLVNIIPINAAITDRDRVVKIIYDPTGTGGASAYVKDITGNHSKTYVGGITLTELFDQFNIEKCKLLKIDCEGAEYDILYGCYKLKQIEYLVGEFHTNSSLQEQGRSPEELAKYCADRVKHMMYYERCIMHE
jgi:FkbM family methyltransferase